MTKILDKNCLLLLISQNVSQLGSSMTSFALIIWAYSVTGKVMSSSLLAICTAVPYIIVSLLGGTVADSTNKKKVILLCDSIAALGSLAILICSHIGGLHLWVLCVVNIINGLMNAFQNPASQVAITLLVDQKYYAKVGGLQSAFSAVVGILNPILAAALLSLGDLTLVIGVDLMTFFFAFLVLLIFIKIPDKNNNEKRIYLRELVLRMKEGIDFIKKQKGILILLIMFSVLEFIGAISFDSMYSPLLLARTNNNETIVGIVSAVAAGGSLLASIFMSVFKQPRRKLFVMFLGSVMCLSGITLFGMGRGIWWWCIVVFMGCFGSPVYQTYQTVILRENVPVSMQGRVFSLQGMITQSLTPVGCFVGALLADYIFEPFMRTMGFFQKICGGVVGQGKGAGMGLMFVLAGIQE